MTSDNAALPGKSSRRVDLMLLLIIAAFLVILLPPAASFVFYSPFPEHHYTDAALPMLRSNDLLTPLQHDGSVRLLKPPFTYWLLIGSYKLFGVSPFSSRLVFLLSGCATIWLTYLLTLKLTADKRAARIAALVLLSHPLIITGSIRSLPDIILTFFILLSGYGFIRLICLNDTRPVSYWLAYGGAAMAVETKGLLGVLFVTYALLFAYFTSTNARVFRRVLNFKIIAAAAVIACLSFLLMIWKHGNSFLQAFWTDQIGQKVDANAGHYVLRAAGFAGIIVGMALPWLFCVGYLFWKAKPKPILGEPVRIACLFALGWLLLLPIAFSGGNLLSVRYVVPGLPFLATTIGIGLSQFSDAQLGRLFQPLLKVAAALFFVLVLFGLLLFAQTDSIKNYLAIAGLVLLVATFAGVQLAKKQLWWPASFSFSCFLFWPVVFGLACPFKLPDESVGIAHEIKSIKPDKNSVVFVGELGLGSRIRIATGGAFQVYQSKSLPQNLGTRLDEATLVVCQSQANLLPRDRFELRQIAVGLNEFSWPDFIAATFKGDAASYIAGRKESYYRAIPNPLPRN